MSPRQVVVQLIQDARRAVPAADADDGVDGIVREHAVQVPRAHLIVPGEVAVRAVAALADHDIIPQRPGGRDGFFNALERLGRAGRRDEPQRVAGAQCFWFDHAFTR